MSRLTTLNELLRNKEVEPELRKKILQKIGNGELVKECVRIHDQKRELEEDTIDLCKEFSQTICRETISNFNTSVLIKTKTGLKYCDLVKLLIGFVDSLNEYNSRYVYVPQLEISLTNKNLIKGEFGSYKNNFIFKETPNVHLVELITESSEDIDFNDTNKAFIDWTITNIYNLLNETSNFQYIWLPSEIISVTNETKTKVGTTLINLYNAIEGEMISFILNLDPIAFEFLTQTLINLSPEQEQNIYDNKTMILQILENLIQNLIYSGGDTILLVKKMIHHELNDIIIKCLVDKNILHFAIKECFWYIYQGYISKWGLLTQIFNLINSNIIPGYLIEGHTIGINNVFEEVLFLTDLRASVRSMRGVIESTTYRYLNDLLRV